MPIHPLIEARSKTRNIATIVFSTNSIYDCSPSSGMPYPDMIKHKITPNNTDLVIFCDISPFLYIYAYLRTVPHLISYLIIRFTLTNSYICLSRHVKSACNKLTNGHPKVRIKIFFLSCLILLPLQYHTAIFPQQQAFQNLPWLVYHSLKRLPVSHQRYRSSYTQESSKARLFHWAHNNAHCI